MTLELHAGRGAGPRVEGQALVSEEGFSARYDVDRDTGIVSRETHFLYGESIVDRILVFPTAKGGVATSWALYDMGRRGIAPRALLFRETNPVMVQGAVFAGIPILAEIEPDPVEAIRTGDWLEVDPASGRILVRSAL